LALAVPLSRFTPRVGGGSAFFVRLRGYANIQNHRRIFSTSIFGGSYSVVGCLAFSDFSGFVLLVHPDERAFGFVGIEERAQSCKDICHSYHHYSIPDGDFDLFPDMDEMITTQPNKSPEPTADGAVSSAIAVHATSRRWLSFFR
jgi:hypothetical protein